MWETWKNISAVIVLAFIIATHPHWVTAAARFVYGTAVAIVKIVQAGAKEVGQTSGSEFKIQPPATQSYPSMPQTQPQTSGKRTGYQLIGGKVYPLPKKTPKELFMEAEKARLFGDAEAASDDAGDSI